MLTLFVTAHKKLSVGLLAVLLSAVLIVSAEAASPNKTFSGVCPPFFIRDESGAVINPVGGENIDKPYSPKQTCGIAGCHDYEKITHGFHFQQGKDEQPSEALKSKYQWILSPGNYGGLWCTPAPNFRQLARKKNTSSKDIDMTSFDFVPACGVCHPGGGPVEYDRNGNRYDRFAADPKNNITPGGDNGFDGDYYKARWAESGVLEADCLICHMPGYNMKARNNQLKALNFRWAASAGAGIATVKGEVKNNQTPSLQYNAEKFDDEGHLDVPLIKEVPTENCLFCHSETDWKKKGSSYHKRFDVHIRAGMKCIECHPAGTAAGDSRINSREEHQIGKGDDPGTIVRDDLDNSVVTCRECHQKGLHRAPIMKHASFKDGSFDVHDQKLACLVCHVPQKAVKAALVQDSTVMNPQPRTHEAGLKRLWSFYGPDMKPWNYYGEMNFTKSMDKPWSFYPPQLRMYKGKLYPVNTLYSIWFGLKTEGKPGLDQVFMQDIVQMWSGKDAYPELAKIKDDNGDGYLEINTPAEIDAAITSLQEHLKKNGRIGNRRVVFVSGNEVYESAHKKETIPSAPHEYSPYGATYKLSHDVAPAGSALGAGGCTDCHAKNAAFFQRPALQKPFDVKANPVYVPTYKVLGYSEEQLQSLHMER